MELTKLFNNVYHFLNQKLFTLGQTDVNLISILFFVLLLVFVVVASRFFARRVLTRILSRFALDPGMIYNFRQITEYTLIFIGIIIAFQMIGINLSGLAVIFGLLSVGIGFGLQNITSNFMSGLILLFERPIKIGDRITVGDTEGDVMEINMRSTTIRSLNNISIIVPNSEFVSSRVINWTHGDPKIRIDIDVGVSYESDLDLVLQTLEQVAAENSEVLSHPKPEVHLREFGDSSWNMKLRVWIMNPKRFYYVKSDINCEIVRKFRENNIEIPFPQRDLHIRSSVPIPHRSQGN